MDNYLTSRRMRQLSAGSVSVIALLGLLAIPACSSGSSVPAELRTTEQQVAGTVLTSWGDPLSGAVVYLIPSDKLDMTPITSADVLAGVSEAYDEPLEDLVTSGKAASFPQAATDSDGGFTISDVDMAKRYYPFVAVDNAMPADVLPGGNLSRKSLTGDALLRLDIEVTGHPSASATFVGSSTCLLCHSDYDSQKTHAHKLGFRQPGKSAPMQDLSNHPDFDAGLVKFVDAAKAVDGTPLWYYDFVSTRGFDKFRVAQSDPSNTKLYAGNAEIKVFLWKDKANSEYKITMRNLVNTGDPDRTFVVDLTYGGALYKQRHMLRIDDPGYKGRYPFLQYQHSGDDAVYDRTRNVYRDYHMDFFWDATNKLFKLPPKTKTMEANCMSCHATGYEYFTDPSTGERLCDAVNDRFGTFDIDGDQILDEINTGCEMCHGPGNEHVSLQQARKIVIPNLLSPSRESQICGACHDRVAGADDLHNDQPLNAAGKMPPPGISRDEFLTNYTSRKGPKMSSFWADELHSKSHHQQYPDFLKSEHYRNEFRILVCADCHNLHGKGEFDGELKGDPKNGELCARCHHTDLAAHIDEKTGSTKAGRDVDCVQCHYYKIAKSGAGKRGLLMGAPTGAAGDAEFTYWENDISSHHTVIPYSNNVGVVGKTPGSAMPVPFVNACATCHSAQNLQFGR